MPRPRRTQISLEDTSMYHCCSRVTRRAFLFGDDALTGKNYDHRRDWVESQLLKLARINGAIHNSFFEQSNGIGSTK